jgi:hypothetical protein
VILLFHEDVVPVYERSIHALAHASTLSFIISPFDFIS